MRRWLVALGLALAGHGAVFLGLRLPSDAPADAAAPAMEPVVVTQAPWSGTQAPVANGHSSRRKAREPAPGTSGPAAPAPREGGSPPASLAEVLRWGNEPPAYPEEAVRREWEGEVLLELSVSSQGEVTDARVVRTAGWPVLDQAALSAARRWRFPADFVRRIGGRLRVPVQFRLE